MELTSLLAASAASPAFKADLLAYAAGQSAPHLRIQLPGRSPPVKVLRLLTQLLAAEPELAIEEVTIDARSGCSDYTGRIEVRTNSAVHAFTFSWDCGWKAEQEQWFDAFGFPDQIRAAQEFGWRCFREWRTAGVTSHVAAPEALAS